MNSPMIQELQDAMIAMEKARQENLKYWRTDKGPATYKAYKNSVSAFDHAFERVAKYRKGFWTY